MSQAGLARISSGSLPPMVPISFEGDNGTTATPALNVITIFSDNASNNSGGSVEFFNSGSTSTLNLTDSLDNTFLGRDAGNTTLTGDNNVSVGKSAASSLTTGNLNVALGSQAMQNATTASDCVAIGFNALSQATFNASGMVAIGSNSCFALTTGNDNTACGYLSLSSCTTGGSNTAVGSSSLQDNVTGVRNTCIGDSSGANLTGDNNTSLGYLSLQQLLAGSDNIAIGAQAGLAFNAAQSSNIVIGNAGDVADANTIRIGTQGSGAGQQDTCFVAGIVGTTVVGNFVNVSASGQLGEVSSATIGQTITGDSGGALSPSSGNWNILGRSGSKTSGSGSTLTINSPPYANQGSSTSVTLNSGSFATATVTLTTPVTAGLADGDLLEFVATTANPLTIQFAATQVGHIGNVASSVAGTFVSTAIGDAICLRYQASTNDWWATSVIGNWTIT